MSAYTELFVVPVPNKNYDAYRRQAEQFAQIWRDHGAVSCVEVEADDAPVGKVTSFPQSVQLKSDETVFVGITTYRSREHRDDVKDKAMKDPRIADLKPESLAFDGMRMFWGGFKPFTGDASGTTPAVQPYLFFRGRCEDAIAYYKSTLGAEAGVVMRFKDNPDKSDHGKVPAELENRIMHAELNIGGATIMMSDGMKSGPLDFQCMSLSLSVQTEAEADRMFAALSQGGKIEMPMGPTFFAKRFGAVCDKFGVSWMIIVPKTA